MLIILATISINAVIGENGLIKQAEKAGKYHANGVASEQDAIDTLLEQYANAMAGTSGNGGNSGNDGGTQTPTETIEISYTIEDLDENTKIINLSYAGLEELSATKLETVIYGMLGVQITDTQREALQAEAATNGTTYEVRLLELVIESNMTITADVRAVLQAQATNYGITYEEYLLEQIIGAQMTVTDATRTGWKQQAKNNGMTYLYYLATLMKSSNVDILETNPTKVTIGEKEVLKDFATTQVYAKRSGTYKVEVETADGAKGEKEIVVEGITNEKFSEIYTASADYTDDLGNTARIPAGFAVGVSDDINRVDKGLVITDSVDSDGFSNGNEYVWIPVSNINGDGSNKIKKSDGSEVEITLGRYTFGTTGTPTLEQAGTNYASETEIGNYKELKTFRQSVDSEGTDGLNETAKDLAGFISSVEANGGFFIARYEASYESGSSVADYKLASKVSTQALYTNNLTQEKLWNNVIQGDIAKASKNMYTDNINVESDLVNSYAWDTAIVFIQNCSNNTNYANEVDGNNVLNNTGLTGDVVCNVYDMSGNTMEWTTEYYTGVNSTNAYPCVYRGGNYSLGTYSYTAYRNSTYATLIYNNISGRSLLYNSNPET